jgi:hypothetical protein
VNGTKSGGEVSTTSENSTQPKTKTFNTEKFRCILNVLYQRLFDKDIEQVNKFEDKKENSISNEAGAGGKINLDPYLLKMRSFLLEDKEFGNLNPLKDLGNISFVRLFNQLFIDFINFEDKYQQQFLQCGLDEVMQNTKLRCEQKYGDNCILNEDQVSYGVKCLDGYVSYKGYFCYIKCPDSYVEQYNKCLKPSNMKVKSVSCILIDS